MRQVNGTAMGRQDCPMGTRMKGTTNMAKDMARSESVSGWFFPLNTLISEY